MKRVDIRCCCTPNKLLGTVPVPSHMLAVPNVCLPLMASPKSGEPRGTIVFEVARWSESRVAIDERGRLERRTEGGIALKHEGVTVETLRRIPGFIEEKNRG